MSPVLFLPGRVKTVTLSEDFSNLNDYLGILLTTFMQRILSADRIECHYSMACLFF